MTIKKALLTIQGYCGKHLSCNQCPLKGNLECMIQEDIPADWDLDEMLKKRKGETNVTVN